VKENSKMAIEEHVNILRHGKAAWNAWKQKHPGKKIDLSGVDLSGAKLIEANSSGANLGYIDLSRIDLIDANLSYANLSFVDFSNADLSNTDLSNTNLGFADLSYATLSYATLSYATLSYATLYRANLSNATISRADLSNATLDGATLSNTTLSYANLFEATLSNATLSNAKVGLTIFGSLDLRTVKGLETIQHLAPSTIGTDTLERSKGDIPESFLKGAGLSDAFIIYARSLVQSPNQYYTCFISYSSQDELFARRLHNDLQQEGVRCWFAPEDMDIGDKIRHRIEESIRLYDKLLLVLSEHSIKSNWVAYEVERALNKEPQGIPNVLYPVRIDPTILTCEKPWAKIIKETRHIGNFEHWTNPQQYEENFKLLLRALNTKRDQQKK